MTNITDIADEAGWATYLAAVPAGQLAFVFFHTPWAASCPQVEQMLRALAVDNDDDGGGSGGVSWASLNAEDLAGVSETLGVSAVPAVVALRDGAVVAHIGGSAIDIRDGVETLVRQDTKQPQSQPKLTPQPAADPEASSHSTSSVATTTTTTTEPPAAAAITVTQTSSSDGDLHRLVNASPVMLFMKGTPNTPQCGFSRQLVALLRERGVKYGFFNVLSDDAIRQNLKTYADWPTYPQLWVKGEFIGGLDIVKEHLSADPGFLVGTI